MTGHRQTIDRSSDDPKAAIIEALVNEIATHPPTIGIIGVSGVGKSSTINAMFKTTLPVSNTVACTKEFQETDLLVDFHPDVNESASAADLLIEARPVLSEVKLRVVDAPGLGEDMSLDHKYLDMYQDNLSSCDVVLWVMSARNRAVALDQKYLAELSNFHDRIVFGINQVDLVEPVDWRSEFNIPSKEQEQNIKIIERDRREKLAPIIGRDPTVACYSSRYGYRLENLFKTLVEACPPARQIVYAGLKNFTYLDFIPIETQRKLSFRLMSKIAGILNHK